MLGQMLVSARSFLWFWSFAMKGHWVTTWSSIWRPLRSSGREAGGRERRFRAQCCLQQLNKSTICASVLVYLHRCLYMQSILFMYCFIPLSSLRGMNIDWNRWFSGPGCPWRESWALQTQLWQSLALGKHSAFYVWPPSIGVCLLCYTALFCTSSAFGQSPTCYTEKNRIISNRITSLILIQSWFRNLFTLWCTIPHFLGQERPRIKHDLTCPFLPWSKYIIYS